MRETKISLVRGDTWVRTWLLKNPQSKTPIDLTGATARLHLRDPNGTLAITASTADGNIVIDELQGRIDLTVSATQTQTLLDFDEGYSFDCELTHGGRVRTIEVGNLHVFLDSTHD